MNKNLINNIMFLSIFAFASIFFIGNVDALSMGRLTYDSGANVRSGPSSNYKVTNSLKYNDTVPLTSTTKYKGTGCSAGWYKINLNGTFGYVCSSNISTSNNTIKINATDGINIRNGAGTSYAIYKKAKYNQTYTLVNTTKYKGTGCSAGWYKIHLNGNTKYVCSNYVKINTQSNVIVTNQNGTYLKTNTSGTNLVKLKYNQALTLYDTTKYKGSKCSSNYYKVYYKGNIRYVCSSDVLRTVSNGTVTNKNGTNIRSGPSSKYSKITNLKYNTYVSLINTTKYKGTGCSAGWYKIHLNGKTRYICSSYINTSSLATYVYKINNLNVRSGPSKSYEVITTVANNTNLTLINTTKYKGTGCSAGWYKININTKTGYVCSIYTKLGYTNDNTNSNTSTNTTTTTSNSKTITKIDTKYSYYNTINKWTYRINEDYAYVRTSPTGTVKDTLYLGTELEYVSTSSATSSCSAGWYKVKYYNNKTGYVCKTYVDKYSDITKTNDSYCTKLKNSGFPASYCPYLAYLNSKYPNWTFKAVKVGDSFLNAVNAERGKNYTTISKSAYITGTGAEAGGWNYASDAYIAFMIDPRNYLNEKNIFAFEQLSYNSALDNNTIVSTLFKNTWLNNTTYVNYFVNAGKAKNVSPGVLAARAKQEGATNKSYDAVSGTVTSTWNVTNSGYVCSSSSYGTKSGSYFKVKSGQNLNVRSGPGTNYSILKYPNGSYMTAKEADTLKIVGDLYTSKKGCAAGWYKVQLNKSLKGIYNFYNIGSYGSNPVLRGLAAAAGYVDSLDGTPWNTIEKGITNGATFIASGYINRGQDTLFYQKFDVDPNTTYYNRYSHQYMTNILAPASEGLATYRSYESMKILNKKYTFKIPVYNSMPSQITTHPIVK